MNVYKLITQGTIEEKVLALQKRKQELFEAMMADKGDFDLSALTWDDLQGLFE